MSLAQDGVVFDFALGINLHGHNGLTAAVTFQAHSQRVLRGCDLRVCPAVAKISGLARRPARAALAVRWRR